MTRRWLRAVRSDPELVQAGMLPTGQLVDHLPSLYEEICSALRMENITLARLQSNARAHGRDRWTRGYQLDELYRELNQLERVMHRAAREFFAATSIARAAQAAAHQVLEDLFSATIHTAIRQLVAEQDDRIAATIAQRDEALDAQRKSEVRLRIAASAAGLGIFEWDVPTRSGVWENTRMYQITGQPESLGPLSCRAFVRELVHSDDAEAVISHYMASMQNGDDFHSIFRILRVDDRAARVVEMHGRFETTADGLVQSFIGTLGDITQRTLAEEALRETDRRKDAFLATLAHELRNPLAPIRNAAQILRQVSADMPPKAEWACMTVERQCSHLTRLIDDLMDVSRISSGKIRLQREVFDIREAIRSAVEINQPIADEHHSPINVTMPARPVFVDGDRTRLTQVFSNLLDNAIKFSGDGTEITVRSAVRGDRVELVVSDMGMGIPASQLVHMFEAYVQLAAPDGRWRPGLGIGLSVVQNLVAMHGGRVTAASDGLGKGSQFTVTLPTTTLATVITDSKHSRRKPMRQLRVLIVDDNRDAAESLALILHGHEARCAFDGETAIVVAEAFRPDAVVLDIGLPGISGHVLAQRLRALPQTACAVLVALSGFGGPEDIARSRQAGCDQHFVKPVDPQALIEYLRDMADKPTH